MSELVHHRPENDQSSTDDQESGLVLLETEQSREEDDLGAEVERLRAEYLRLRPLDEAAGTLELGILTGGLLDASDEYGADQVVRSLRNSFSYEGNATLNDVYKKLIPDTGERKRFLAGINDQDSVMHAIERINDIGGTQDSSWDLSDQFERARRFDAQSLSKRKQRRSGSRNTMTYFDDSHRATGFNDVMLRQPELIETPISEGGDIVDVVKSLRDTYASGVESYMQEHARIIERVEASVVDRQRPVQELRDLSDSILASEVQRLEATLNDIDDDSQRALISGMLEARATETQEKRAQFDAQLEAVRTDVLRELGAEHADALVLREPTAPTTIEDTRSWRSNVAS